MNKLKITTLACLVTPGLAFGTVDLGPVQPLGFSEGLLGVSSESAALGTSSDLWTSDDADWLYCGAALTAVIVLVEDFVGHSRSAGPVQTAPDATPEPGSWVALSGLLIGTGMAGLMRRRSCSLAPQV